VSEIVIVDKGKRVYLVRDGVMLADATPCHRMEKRLDGTRYRPWLVQISTPGHKYGFVTVPSRARAIQLMESDQERTYHQGRPMGLGTS
jgi:hypothetical protein